ncbi:MAG TPA: 50S ribosomal protein L13 [Rhizomicrobium sp.]|nr:50S ribosomal protein L13 [Rhizomicrobium sp.]
MKTYSAKASEIEKKWVVIDADGLVVGRLASLVALRLRGKHKATYTPHMDCGDNVIVVNAAKAVFTGNKLKDKVYNWHTGYIGGIKYRSAQAIISGKHPERVVEKAVERMLPRGPLGKRQLANLRVYPGAEHPHDAQKPEAVDIAAMNPKNSNFKKTKAA